MISQHIFLLCQQDVKNHTKELLTCYRPDELSGELGEIPWCHPQRFCSDRCYNLRSDSHTPETSVLQSLVSEAYSLRLPEAPRQRHLRGRLWGELISQGQK